MWIFRIIQDVSTFCNCINILVSVFFIKAERFARLTIFFTSCHLDNMAGVGLGTVAELGKLFETQLRSRGGMEANFVNHSKKWYRVRTVSCLKCGYAFVFHIWIVLSALTLKVFAYESLVNGYELTHGI